MHGWDRVKYIAASTGLLCLLGCLLGCAWLYATQIRPLELYRWKKDKIAERLGGLENHPPAGVDPHAWQNLAVITNIGFGNVFFYPTHASYPELLRFEKDLEEKLRTDQPVGVETLRWIWVRLRDTGPHGKRYSERMMALFEDGASQIGPPLARANLPPVLATP